MGKTSFGKPKDNSKTLNEKEIVYIEVPKVEEKIIYIDKPIEIIKIEEKIVYIDKPIEVIKTEYVDKIVEVPKIEYKDKVVEKEIFIDRIVFKEDHKKEAQYKAMIQYKTDRNLLLRKENLVLEEKLTKSRLFLGGLIFGIIVYLLMGV